MTNSFIERCQEYMQKTTGEPWEFSSSLDKRRYSVSKNGIIIAQSGPDDLRHRGNFENFQAIVHSHTDFPEALRRLGLAEKALQYYSDTLCLADDPNNRTADETLSELRKP